LIEPSSQPGWQYYSKVPAPFKARPGEWLLVPIFHLFGSEELSRQAQSISQLTPRPYLALNPAEASQLGMKAGEQIRVTVQDSLFELELVLRADLPRGVAGVPAGLPPLEGLMLPAFGKLSPTLVELSASGAARGVV
jgi:NADH-quinone oxidoreductase subunit G